jgi:hypothetical protein
VQDGLADHRFRPNKREKIVRYASIIMPSAAAKKSKAPPRIFARVFVFNPNISNKFRGFHDRETPGFGGVPAWAMHSTNYYGLEPPDVPRQPGGAPDLAHRLKNPPFNSFVNYDTSIL